MDERGVIGWRLMRCARDQMGGLIPLPAVKHHFKVSNSYVVKKIGLVLFPWRHKPWARKTYRMENGQAEWLPPRDDINSPDLYIPGTLHIRTCDDCVLTKVCSDGARNLRPPCGPLLWA